MLRKIKDKTKISNSTIKKASIASIDNAFQLYEEAKYLFEKGSYGRSYSLICLSIEELAKFLMLFVSSFEWFPIEERKKMLNAATIHKEKIGLYKALILFMKIFGRFMYGYLDVILDVKEKGLEKNGTVIKETKSRFLADYMEYLKRLRTDGTPEAIRMKRLLEILDNLDENKQMGFYVDVHNNTTTVLSPNRIKKEQVIELMDIFENELKEIAEYAKVVERMPKKLRIKFQQGIKNDALELYNELKGDNP